MSSLEQLPNTYRSFFGRFACLTDAQKALIQPILDKRDVVLQAGTGSGKTEAILAPATERLMTHSGHFTILYIVPTRALALDMHRRICPLYQQLGLKSGIRTGDGKTLQNGKPHLLILTPESLDVLLGSPNPENKYFLKHLGILIIDEVHMFLRTERGSHLSYLRRRLELQVGGERQTLTLSATIADPQEICTFFHLKHVFYYEQAASRVLVPCWVHIENEQRELTPFVDDLLLRWKCKKILVFANSRKKCEQLFEILSRCGHFSDCIWLHYSNLSTKERRLVESSFRACKQGLCIATSTLEMGIDIGDIDGVVLMGPPPSSMAFLQRIGRGNRRQSHLHFWGVCYGAEAERQLLRFLALFEQALANKMERRFSDYHFSVLFQQVLSCLYAKKAVSKHSLVALFPDGAISSILDQMLANNWLRPSPGSGLYAGGWRYGIALHKLQIWSNFPPSDDEYEVVLEAEVIATLPSSAVQQLEVGDIFQLAGKGLKLLHIEEKRASQEISVATSSMPITKELDWCGEGVPVSFEMAQSMKSLLLNQAREKPRGLMVRTERLLESAAQDYTEYDKCLYVRRLPSGGYAYATFLGTVGNFILYHQIKRQCAGQIEGLCVRYDEMGIETNEWIRFETLELPISTHLFQEWVSAHLPLLRQAFSWNMWLPSLPEALQQREIVASLLDTRVLEYFARYKTEKLPPLPPPLSTFSPTQKRIPLQGRPWSFEQERQAWEELTFPEIPHEVDHGLTASQLQSYVVHNTCPRLAFFQRMRFRVEPHPRLSPPGPASDFKHEVFSTLDPLRFETPTFTLKQAVEEVLMSQASLFLAQAKLSIDHPFSMKGTPDLIYLKGEGSHVRLEVWDIKDMEHVTYAQKWRLALCVYLLEHLLQGLPVVISHCAGVVHREGNVHKRTAFALLHFMSWMPRLIAQWRADAQGSTKHVVEHEKHRCASCRYFSYCYQETLLSSQPSLHQSEVVCIEPESIHPFPRSDDWPSIRSFLRKHFIWPVDGLLTATQVGRCLGLVKDPPMPVSLYHDDPCVPPDLSQAILTWCAAHVSPVHTVEPPPKDLVDTYLWTERQQQEQHTYAVRAFQKNPLSVRVEQFRAIGPLVFLGIISEKRQARYLFSFKAPMPSAKFRVGDFLKLAPVNSAQIQEGFTVILTSYSSEEGRLCVQSLSGKMLLSRNQLYALDECATDWNALKIEAVLHQLKDPGFRPKLLEMLQGIGKSVPLMRVEWVEQWAERADLNAAQKRALLLPFLNTVGLIEGPPGTGKTHLLVWTLRALIAHARATERPIKMLVTALTHQAIDQILFKLAHTLDLTDKIPIWKQGQLVEAEAGVEPLIDAKQLLENTSYVLGSTGFGVYQLLEGKQFPQLFDWVITDEASQVVPAHAFLSLVFGKGNALFYGDTQQLPPITRGDVPVRSILAELIARFAPAYRVRLNETYRMNKTICQFISRHWYNGELQSVVTDQHVELPYYPLRADSMDAYLDPAQSLVVVPIEHEGNTQSSKEEALWIAQAVGRLVIDYTFSVKEIGIISPHRLQTHTIFSALKEVMPSATHYPHVDTVERMQGQEFDLVFFSATVSDREHLHSAFLKDYRRFNVAMSRARKKFLFVASPLFFQSFPRTEKELAAQFPFEDFFNLVHRRP